MAPLANEPLCEILCPHCGRAVETAVDFCESCGAPVGPFTTLDPCKAIYVEGWLFRRSTRPRRGPLVLVGLWVLFGVPLLGTVAMAITGGSSLVATNHIDTLLICLVALPLLVRATLNFVRDRPGTGPYDPGR